MLTLSKPFDSKRDERRTTPAFSGCEPLEHAPQRGKKKT